MLDVMDIVRPDELGDIADLGLTLPKRSCCRRAFNKGRCRPSQGPTPSGGELSFLRRACHLKTIGTIDSRFSAG